MNIDINVQLQPLYIDRVDAGIDGYGFDTSHVAGRRKLKWSRCGTLPTGMDAGVEHFAILPHVVQHPSKIHGLLRSRGAYPILPYTTYIYIYTTVPPTRRRTNSEAFELSV